MRRSKVASLHQTSSTIATMVRDTLPSLIATASR
jgi:hypothetical protein